MRERGLRWNESLGKRRRFSQLRRGAQLSQTIPTGSDVTEVTVN